MKLTVQLAGLLLAGMFPLAGPAQVYKCRDADGAVRFTDRPCDDTSGLLSFPAGAGAAQNADGARMEKTRKLLRAMRQERLEDHERSRREEDEHRQRLQQCNTARDRLTYLESAGALYRLNDAGERMVLSDAQHSDAIEEQRQRIEKFCDGANK